MENEFCNKHDVMKPCKKCVRENAELYPTYFNAEQRALRQANRIARNLGF